MKVLVTGCSGFIGSNLVERLAGMGHEVAGIDNLATGSTKNVEGMEFDFMRGSINDGKLMKKAVEGVECVFHNAAIPSVSRSISDPAGTNEANISGTLSVLLAARDNGVKRLVFASSSSVYGNTPELPKREEMRCNPASPYALSKYAGEVYCRLFNEIYGLETISLRYFNIFGPRQNPDSQYSAVIPKFIKQMMAGKRPLIFGDGSTSRDFTYVENALKANILSMKAPARASGKAYNIACGERVTIENLVREINTLLGTNLRADHGKERPGDVKHSLADISLAKEYLGYEPAVRFVEGLKKTVEWYKTC